jgi:hypothetical protein
MARSTSKRRLSAVLIDCHLLDRVHFMVSKGADRRSRLTAHGLRPHEFQASLSSMIPSGLGLDLGFDLDLAPQRIRG